MSETRTCDVSALMGETITEINGLTVGSDSVSFLTASGRAFRMFHEQDCCESVSVNEIIGNIEDLIGSPLLKAEEASNENDEAWTWTFYHFATMKGYVTLRWLGESKGYYSESVCFVEDK